MALIPFQLCEKQLINHWSRQWDPVSKVPYTFSGNQWISYDDVESVALKVKFAIEEQLGGAMIWSIETDDFHGLCQHGKYPLLTTINTVLNGGVEIPPPTSTTPKSTSTTQSSTSTSTPTTGAPPSSIDCKKDGYYRDPKDCSSFIICTNQLAYRFQCPSPLMYDESIRGCNWPSAVTC